MKLWDGRFAAQTDSLMEEFHNSLPFDQALIAQDIQGSIAWARALHRAELLDNDELTRIVGGLEGILADYDNNTLAFLPSDEDIHMAVERVLIEQIGEAGAKLHTGRSRNDQVATDFRLYVMQGLGHVCDLVVALQKALLERAESDAQVIVPGYTHLQQAQAVALSHYWMGFFFALEREKVRLAQARECADLMPLGAGALAGSGFPVDRQFLAEQLGFSAVSDNSMDAVASRDFALQCLAACASLGILISRHAEDLIIWSSHEFGFVELDDAWATGSSMMPQKKNPDSLELIRGKTGRFIGNHTRLATTLKGVGLTYYKDLQEDKEPVFDSLGNMALVLQVAARVLETLQVKADRMAGDLDSLLWATDVADYLVSRGMPFREAHQVVGKLVKYCIDNKLQMSDVQHDTLRGFSPLFGDDIAGVFSWDAALSHRDIPGGTGPESVKIQIKRARALLG